MSFRHIEQLNVVRDEFDTILGATEYVRIHWQEAAGHLESVHLYELEAAMDRLEATYVVRLTAGYEAVVFEALQKLKVRKVHEKASGVELTDALSGWLQDSIKATAPRLTSSDRRKIKEVKARAANVRDLLRYRNKIAHRKPPEDEEFGFASARSCLNLMLDLIP